jgi:hypothetical protein
VARAIQHGHVGRPDEISPALLNPDKTIARNALRTFVEKVAKNQLDDYVSFRPTYVRLELTGRAARRNGKVFDLRRR